MLEKYLNKIKKDYRCLKKEIIRIRRGYRFTKKLVSDVKERCTKINNDIEEPNLYAGFAIQLVTYQQGINDLKNKSTNDPYITGIGLYIVSHKKDHKLMLSLINLMGKVLNDKENSLEDLI
ncbi:MAG: hypothetical protein ACP5OG_03865 [Candidatus Nanoarchaeia archaeon]